MKITFYLKIFLNLTTIHAEITKTNGTNPNLIV